MITTRGDSREALLAINAVTPEDPRNPLTNKDTRRSCLDGDAVTASLSFVNAALGAGVLAYPFAFSAAGLVVAASTTLFIGCLSTFSLCIIMHSMQVARSRVLAASSVSSFGDLVREVLGPKGSTFLEVLIVGNGFGACVGYIEVIEDAADSVTSDARLSSFHISRKEFRLIALCVAALPCVGLSCLRSIEALKYSAAASVIAVFFVVGTLLYQAIENPCNPNACVDEHGAHGWDEGSSGVALWPTLTIAGLLRVLKALPLIAFALQMHIQCPAVFDAMPARLQTSISGRRLIAVAAVGLVLCLYLPIGIAGVVRFGQATEPDVLNNFGVGDQAANVARACMCLTALAAFPAQHFPARTVLYKVWKKVRRCCKPADLQNGLPEEELERNAPAGGLSLCFALTEAVLWNAAVLGVAGFAVLNNIKLDIIFQLLGAIVGASVILIIPGLLWARVGSGRPGSLVRVAPSAVLIILGLFLMFTGTFVSLQELPSLFEKGGNSTKASAPW